MQAKKNSKEKAGAKKEEPASHLSVVKNEKTDRTIKDFRITHAKITKLQTLEVSFKEIYADGTTAEVEKICADLVHPDLKEAFRSLIPHLIVICDQKGSTIFNAKNINDLDSIDAWKDGEDYKVSSFTIAGEDQNEGITVSGTKKIGSKKLNLHSPFTKWEDKEYKYIDKLSEALHHVIDEVKEYLTGKFAVVQLEMELETPDENVVTETTGAGPEETDLTKDPNWIKDNKD